MRNALASYAILLLAASFIAPSAFADITRIEQDHPSVSYEGSWQSFNGSAVSGGSVVAANTAGAAVTVNFSGTGIAWIGYRCPCASGRARVYIDGVPQAVVNNHAASAQPQQAIYGISGLPDGAHVLRIEVMGESAGAGDRHVVVDAFDIQREPPGTLIEEGDFAVSYTGAWMEVRDASVSGGSVRAARDRDATATVSFYGTGITWIGYRCPCTAGIATLTHITNSENHYHGQKHTFAPEREAQVEIYRLEGLPLGPHTFTITVTGDSVGSSDWVVVDAFRPLLTATGGGMESTPPTVTLTAPEAGALVTGTVRVAAAATDNVGVTKVQFFAGSTVYEEYRTLLAEDSTPPYEFTRDTTALPSGSTYQLWARAIDAAGNVGRSTPVTATVQHTDRTRPTVTITEPAAGSTVSGAVRLSATATDDYGIRSVRFNIDGMGFNYYPNPPIESPPYSMLVNTAALTDGSHSFWAFAVDTAGNASDEVWIPVTVDNRVVPGRVRVDDDDPAIEFSSGWSLAGDILKQFHWQSAAVSTTPGATATFTFNGTGVRWLSMLCTDCGYATVTVDGGAPQVVNLWGGPMDRVENRVAVAYESPVLADGVHTVTITVNEPLGSQRFVYVDGFEVLND